MTAGIPGASGAFSVEGKVGYPRVEPSAKRGAEGLGRPAFYGHGRRPDARTTDQPFRVGKMVLSLIGVHPPYTPRVEHQNEREALYRLSISEITDGLKRWTSNSPRESNPHPTQLASIWLATDAGLGSLGLANMG